MVGRQLIVSVVLVGMLGTVGVVGVGRARANTQLAVAGEQGVVAGDVDASSSSLDPEAVIVAEHDRVLGPEQAPVRVVGLGWEVLAPGIVVNDGRTPGPNSRFEEAGVKVTFDAADDVAEIQRRLGRGGNAEAGADVALIPYPEFVASYERLRALSPQVFFVVGWSRGRDAVSSGSPTPLRPATRDEVVVQGRPGDASTLLALFALDQSGVSLDRVHLEPPTTTAGPRPPRGAAATLVTVERSLRSRDRRIDARELVLSTAEATHLVPIVAIAPAGYLDRNHAALVTWAETWLVGVDLLHTDPPGAARQIAADEAAPEVVDIIDAMGWVSFASMPDNARMAGLAGRGAVNLEVLFRTTWELWRAVGVLTTPQPERVPLSTAVIAEVAITDAGGHAPAPAVSDVGSRRGSRPLVIHARSEREIDDDIGQVLQDRAAFLAGVFSRSPIRVAVRGQVRRARTIAAAANERHGLSDRITAARRPPIRSTATISVMPAD